MMRKIFSILFLSLFLSSCIEIIAVSTFGAGYLASRDKTITQTATDSKILTQSIAILHQESTNKEFNNLNLSVYNGRVLLTGHTAKRDHIQQAMANIWKISNVKEIINEVNTDSESKDKNHIFDFLLLTQIKLKLILNKETDAKNVNLSVYNQNIYILGSSKEEDNIKEIANIAAKVKGVKKVYSHITS